MYSVPQGIAVPSGATFTGNPTVSTSIIISEATASNYVLSPGSNSKIAYITFNANNSLPSGCCSAVILIGDVSNALVHDCEALGQDEPVATGAYFIDARAINNTLLRVNITAMHYGAIFLAGLLPGSDNRLVDSHLWENHCDAVTFAGYGELLGSTIERNGWDCKNGNPPIPGGGPYALGNTAGALVVGNNVTQNCGMVFDIDSCANFVVTDNSFLQPGHTWDGAYPYCMGSLAVNLIDTSSFLFARNTVTNTMSSNAVGLSSYGDPNNVFENTGAAEFSDLPNGANTVLALTITTRSSTIMTTSNAIVNNTFHADCNTAGCAGIGYFAGRGTGWSGNAGPWSPNMYTGNDPFGSDIGSRRCGGNWYAGNTPECPDGAPYPCNEDDFQHPDVQDWRNDAGCAQYS